jgi:Uncharacterized protein conserved in bacteria
MANMNVSYGELQTGAADLKRAIEELNAQNEALINQVNQVFNIWGGSAKESYEADFSQVKNNVKDTLEVATQLADAVEKYAKDIEAVEHGNSSSRIG